MRIVRVEHEGKPRYGQLLDGDAVRLWNGPPWHGGQPREQVLPAAGLRRLVPVQPSKILCVGRNYAAHARELGNEVPDTPLLFLKAPSTLCADGEFIDLPPQSQRVEHEGEVGVVLGEALKTPSREQARRAIFGVTCVNDVTARDIQRADGQFTRGKSYDTFCPTGPWVETDFALDALWVRTCVNGEQRQRGEVAEMSFPILDLLVFMAHQMTLLPGDLICTGTPDGVGPLGDGDEVTVEIPGVGPLRNPVRRARA